MQDTPKTTAALARVLYPEPTPYAHKARSGAYCVMGALNACLQGLPVDRLPMLGRFPNERHAAAVLCDANPRLGPLAARIYASGVTAYNDSQDYDRAWAAVDAALAHGAGK